MDFTEEQQAEIKKQIDEAVSKAVEETTTKLTKEHNDTVARIRKNEKEERETAIQKAKDDAKLSSDELAKKQVEEQIKAKDTEIAELRAYKKVGELTKKLAEAGVPTLFVNDSRLLNAEEDKVDEVIKSIKDEFSKLMPSGATVSTNVNTSGSKQEANAKAKRFEEFAKMR